MSFNYDIPKLCRFVEALGEDIISLRDRGLEVRTKEDGSKVTNGDFFSHQRLIDFLGQHYPYPIISEEQENPHLFPMGIQWVVDPIDGTSHYLKGENDFSIMLALVHNREAVMSLIYQPAYRNGYYAEVGKGGYRFSKGARGESIKADHQTPINNRAFQLSSTKNYIGEYKWFTERNIHNYQIRGGIGIKLGAIAEGRAHYYLNLDRPLKVWDVLPSVLLAREAGAWVGNAHGGEVIYDESGYALSQGLCVAPDKALLPLLKKTDYVHRR